MFNWIDLLIIGVIAFYLWRGWNEGFVRVGLDLLGLALIFWAGWRFYPPLATWLSAQLDVPEVYGKAFGFLLAGITAACLYWIVIGATVGRLPASVHHNWLNRVLGFFPALLSGLLAAALVVTFVSVAPMGMQVTGTVQASAIGSRLLQWTTDVEGGLRPIFGDAIAESLNFLTVKPEDDAFIQLPYQVPDPQPKPELEEQMLQLVNEERAKVGLPTLVMDESLRQLARAHSRDMFQQGYFSHYTPDRLSPFDRMQAVGIHYLAAGENLALAPTLQVAHRGLMNSPGHKANILSPAFRRVGIGVMDGGLRGLMFSQEFTN